MAGPNNSHVGPYILSPVCDGPFLDFQLDSLSDYNIHCNERYVKVGFVQMRVNLRWWEEMKTTHGQLQLLVSSSVWQINDIYYTRSHWIIIRDHYWIAYCSANVVINLVLRCSGQTGVHFCQFAVNIAGTILLAQYCCVLNMLCLCLSTSSNPSIFYTSRSYVVRYEDICSDVWVVK